MKRNLILTPGPTQVPPQVCGVLGEPIIHHRTPQFQAVLKEATENLKEVFKTKNDVLILTSSGTGAMEAAVANLLSAGDKALTVEGGKFGERWSELCRAYKAQPTVIKVEWGKSVEPAKIEEELKKNPDIRAVFVTLCETSTGVITDVEAVGRIVGKTDAVLVVDAISALGATEMKTDEWGIDVAVGGSQKGLMLPPGLSFIAVSPKALALAEQSTSPRYYFDLMKAKKSAEKSDTPFTPALGIIRALNESLRLIKEEGIDNLIARHAKLTMATRAAAQALGLELLTSETDSGGVVTSIMVPEGVDGTKIVKRMRDVYGVTVAGGQAQLKGKIIRIAHMGMLDEFDILTGIACLEKALKETGYPVQLGAGLSAAQKVFNS